MTKNLTLEERITIVNHLKEITESITNLGSSLQLKISLLFASDDPRFSALISRYMRKLNNTYTLWLNHQDDLPKQCDFPSHFWVQDHLDKINIAFKQLIAVVAIVKTNFKYCWDDGLIEDFAKEEKREREAVISKIEDALRFFSSAMPKPH